jgi:hypothetical protein
LPIRLGRARKNRFERRYNGGVELGVDRLGDSQTSHPGGHRLAVRAVGGHRIVRISNSEDPGDKRNVIADQTVRVPIAINTLVMVAHNASDICVIFNLRKDAFANRWVFFHLPALLKGKRAGLLKQPSRKTDLSNVVHKATEVGDLLLFLRQPEACCDVL